MQPRNPNPFTLQISQTVSSRDTESIAAMYDAMLAVSSGVCNAVSKGFCWEHA